MPYGLPGALSTAVSVVKLLEVNRNDGAFAVKQVYSAASPHFSQYQDDTVLLGDRLYGSSSSGVFSCYNWKTGAVLWQKRMGKETVTYADGNFYFHGSDGKIRLVENAVTGPIAKAEFALPDHRGSYGTSTPVVCGGRLYVREDDQLFCYDVRAEALKRPPAEPHAVVLASPVADPANEHRNRTPRSVFVPTPQDIVEKMLELAKVKKTDVVYDLGSGDGRIVITSAKKYGCRAVGYEIDKELLESSRAKAEAAGVKTLVTLKFKDLFTADLRDADVIAVYLVPKQLEQLMPQLEKLKPGARIVSHLFAIPGIKPDRAITCESREDGERHTLSMWTAPLTKAQQALPKAN